MYTRVEPTAGAGVADTRPVLGSSIRALDSVGSTTITFNWLAGLHAKASCRTAKKHGNRARRRLAGGATGGGTGPEHGPTPLGPNPPAGGIREEEQSWNVKAPALSAAGPVMSADGIG